MKKLILITPLNIERVITISVFSADLSPIYQIFPVEFSLKKKTIFTKNDELINSATEQSYSLWLPLVSFVVDGK